MNKKIYIVILCLFNFIGAYAQFETGRSYSIESRSTGRSLRANSSSNITFGYTRNQSEWYIIDNGDTTFKIKNSTSDEVLSVANASTQEDASLATEIWTNSDHQKWSITANEHFYSITNLNSGLVLSAINELPTNPDANPDLAYYNSYSSVGEGVQKTNVSEKIQQFHIAPIKDSREEALVVPQLGWKPEHNKEALLVSNTSLGTPQFEVINKSNNAVVLSGNMVLRTSTSTWDQFYYTADLTSLTILGEYKIKANGLTTNITIADKMYENPKYSKGGNLTFSEMFNGFWKYNHFHPETQTITKASLDMVNGEEVFTENGTYNVEPFGWFDAHSRDSKLGRSAKAASDLCFAHKHVSNSANRMALETEIRYGLQQLLESQNPDGSCPAGRIRETTAPRIYYNWTTNIDVNTSARAVKAYALAYQIFKNSDPEFATSLLAAAEKGWQFVLANESLVDDNLNASFKGQTVDILTAAIEMAHATGESTYFDKADEMFNAARFTKGYFHKEFGSFPSENSNIYASLDNGSIPFLCRYLDIARTDAMKARVEIVINDFTDFWLSKEVSIFGFPKHPLDRTTDFGNIIQVARYAYSMLAVADYTDNPEAYKSALSAFNFLTGYNPYATSYIVGIGDSDITSSVNFFKRSFEDGIGSFLPGFTSDGTIFVQNFNKYQTTEGVVPVNSTLFYMLSRFDSYRIPSAPKAGELIINKVNSHEQPTASWVQIYNPTDYEIILDGVKLEHFRNAEPTPDKFIYLSGMLEPHGHLIVTRDDVLFESIYGIAADYKLAGMYLNPSTNGLILRDDQNGIIDQFNDVPVPTTTFMDDHFYIRERFDNDGSDITNHWCDMGTFIKGSPSESTDSSINYTYETITACSDYTWDVNQITYTESGTYTSTISCNSKATLYLTINSLDNSVTKTTTDLTSNMLDVSYQWLDCDNGNEEIQGATNQSYTPSTSGNYAVEISNGICTTTSACYSLVILGIEDVPFTDKVKLYPNPASNFINLQLDNYFDNIQVNIRSIEGKLLETHHNLNGENIQLEFDVYQGVYFVEVISNEGTSVLKVVKQ